MEPFGRGARLGAVAGEMVLIPLLLGCGEGAAAPSIPELRRLQPLALEVAERSLMVEEAGSEELELRVWLDEGRVRFGEGAVVEVGNGEWVAGEGMGTLIVGGAALEIEGEVGEGERWSARVAGESVTFGGIEGWGEGGVVSGEGVISGKGNRVEGVVVEHLEWAAGETRISMRGRGTAEGAGWGGFRVEELLVEGEQVRVAGIELSADLELAGRLDSLGVVGRVGVRGMKGVVGSVSGWAGLPAGALHLQVSTGQIALSDLPLPEHFVAPPSGSLSGGLEVGGSLGAPELSGMVELGPGSVRLTTSGLVLDSVQGRARYEAGHLLIDSLSAIWAGGRLRGEGSIRIAGGARRLEGAVGVEGARLEWGDENELVLSAVLGVAGPLESPRLSGSIDGIAGRLRAGLFRGSGALDLSDPPYAELAGRVPWPSSSRLLRGRRSLLPAGLHGELSVVVTPELRVVSDDSELFGSGRIRVVVDSAGWRSDGVLRVEGGRYAFFGERFRIIGGAVRFDGTGLAPRLGLIAEHEGNARLGGGLQGTTTVPSRFPAFTYFLHGEAATARGRLLQNALVPSRSEALAERLIYGLAPDLVTGWGNRRRWLADRPGRPLNHRAAAQGAPLIWSYIANEGYRLAPMTRGWLLADNVVVGDGWGGGLVVGPVIGVGGAPGWGVEGVIAQPLVSGAAPGIRVERRLGDGGALGIFSKPRFDPAPMIDGERGYSIRRKTGVGLRWRWEW